MWAIERNDHVAVVTMNSNKVNAQSEEFFEDLHRAFDTLEKEHADCSVVLTGKGVVFSAGLDLKQVLPLFATRDQSRIEAWWQRYRATNYRLFSYPRPTVAAVNGHAFAGGLITALACDRRIAASGTARFSLNEVRIGIPMPSIYVEIIRYALGDRVCDELCLGAREYGVPEAAERGLFDEVVSPEKLLPRASEVAGDVLPDTFRAYAQTKTNLHAPTMARIAGPSAALDQAIPGNVSDIGCLRAQARRFAELTGEPPSWPVP